MLTTKCHRARTSPSPLNQHIGNPTRKLSTTSFSSLPLPGVTRIRPGSGIVIRYFLPLRVDNSVVPVRTVGQPEQLFHASAQTRQVEIVFLKFPSAVALRCDRLPYQNTIIRPPTVTSDSVVRLELGEHLRIKSAVERVELVPCPLFIRPLANLSPPLAGGNSPRLAPHPRFERCSQASGICANAIAPRIHNAGS